MKVDNRTAEELIELATGGDKPVAGSKGRVIADYTKYAANPDKMMVSHGVASNQLPATNNMNISPSKLYEDGGKKLESVQFLAQRGVSAVMPRDRVGLLKSLSEFFEFCGINTLPPTLGGFAVWNGITITRLNQLERDTTNSELSSAIGLCKECIRNFIEISAMDSSLNPIVYFHHNKVYYGAVENAGLTVKIEDNRQELTDEEYQSRIIELQKNENGVYTID